MNKFVCKYCGLGPAIYEKKGPHTGEWCSFCKKWIRWVPKIKVNEDDVEQLSVFDIETTDNHHKDYEEHLEEELPWD